MRRTLSLIFCAPYVIISGKWPDINIHSSKSSQNGHGCLDDDILQLFKDSGFSKYTYCKRNSKFERRSRTLPRSNRWKNYLASILVTRISKEVRDKTSWNKTLSVRKIVEKVIIYTFTQEHHEFQRRKGKTYFSAASAILFVWVTNGVILPLECV
jgi:ribosomal protein L17